MQWKRVALSLVSLGFGFMIAAGGAFEVANLLDPSLFPEAQDNPIMRLHHSRTVVFDWTLASNLAGIAVGIALVATGIGLWRRRAWSARLGRWAARAMLIICAGGALVCGVYLVPPLVRGLADEALHGESLALLISIACSTLLVPIFPAILQRALAPARAARIFANKTAGPVLPMDESSTPPVDLRAGVGLRTRN